MNIKDFYKTYLQYPQIFTDSRKVISGCLYFSLKGDHFDGNHFAADAIAKGCSYAVVDDPSVVAGEKYILVPSVLRFLQDLASFHRNHLAIPVIGITGTNGKTTTKELVCSVLKQKYKVVANTGNLNNHIGVPVTILSAHPETEILVVEMGANHPGEIDFLCNIARPTCGLVTNIGKAHLEGFGSFEGVIRAKNEMYAWIRENQGTLFVNDDDPLLKELVGDYSCQTYGTGNQADITGKYSGNGLNLSFSWKMKEDGSYNLVGSHLTGGYNFYNILAAISVGCHFGLDKDQIREGIESYQPDNMRSQWIRTGSNVLLLDAYNANPSSMALAIGHFASLGLPHPVAILGDMFELGSFAPGEHLRIIRLAHSSGFEQILFSGHEFYRYSTDFPHHFYQDLSQLEDYLVQHPLKDCNILIKGSRGMKLETIVGYL